MNYQEEMLIQHAQRLGAKLDQRVHLSWTIQLPEGMTLEAFVKAMSDKLSEVRFESPRPAREALRIPPEISALPELGWNGKPVK